MERREFIGAMSAAGAISLLPDIASAAAPRPDFNRFLIRAIDEIIVPNRSGGGYDINYAYSRELDYASAKQITQTPGAASRPPAAKNRTMCVAAVAEVIIEAINLYVREGGAGNAHGRIPAAMWTDGSVLSLRPYLWLQVDTRDIFRYPAGQVPRSRAAGKVISALSRGSAHTFSIWRMGEELPFSSLREGDFINLNRLVPPRKHATGHSVIFRKFIGEDNKYTPTWSPGVRGFMYFSAQGSATAGGFAHKDAYFAGRELASTVEHPLDYGVAKQSSQLMLNSGRLWAPTEWDIVGARQAILGKVAAATPLTTPNRDAAINAQLLEPQGPSLINFIGEDE